MSDEQALKTLIAAGAKLLRYWQLPDPSAPHVVGKNPEGLGDWHRIAGGGPGATLEACIAWLRGEECTLANFVARVVEPHARRYPDKKPIDVPASVKPGIGLLPSSIGKLVVDVDLASKRALKTMAGDERRDRAIAGLAAVDAALRTPDGSQTTPSDGLHLYYPADGIPEDVTNNATWAIDKGGVKVGGDLRGTNGWVGVYDLGALAMMVEAGHGPALDVERLRAFVNNPHRELGMRAYRHVRAGSGSTVQAACAAIRSAEAGDTYAGRNPTIVHHVAVLANNKLLDDAAAKAVLDAVAEVKPEAIADTERFIGKARRYFAESTGNTGGPAGVRGEPRPGHDTGEIPGGAAGDGGAQGSIPDRDDPDTEDDAIAEVLARWQGQLDAFTEQQAERKPGTLRQLREAARDALAVLVDRDGADRGSGTGEIGQLRELQAAFRDGKAKAVNALLEAQGLTAKPREAVAVPDVKGERPAPLLSLAGQPGAVLSLGTVGVLSGEGGMGKSALTASLAVTLASRGEGEGGPLVGGLFDAPIGGGPVLVASWEDSAAVTRWRIEAAAKALKLKYDAVRRVFLMDLAGSPLYGPGARGESAGLYNARPEPLAGWRDLWREVARLKPRLVVIDPVLSAFVGNSNDAAPVREFLAVLSVESARDDGERQPCAVLLVAHSNKAARGGETDPFDPGQVGGSAAWTDGVRSALVLGWDYDRGPGERHLAVAKSNYGPARRALPLKPVRVGGGDKANAGAVVGFQSAGQWDDGGAGDVGRTVKALEAGVKALRKAHPGADLTALKRAIGAGRNRRDKAEQGGDDTGGSERHV